MDRIKTIIRKEWAEVFKNRMVLLTVAIMPIVFTVMPLIMVYVTGKEGGGGGTDMPAQFLAVCGASNARDCMQIFILNQFIILFMLMPVIIPVTIAAYSIVGEKTTRSLEPLLATPITTSELLVAKSLAAALPAIFATWICFFIFLLCLPLVGASAMVSAYVAGPIWLLAVFLMGPLLSIAAVNVAILVSSRVNDPRVAEQISSLLILPLMLLMVGQVIGLFALNVVVMLIASLVIAGVDVVLVALGVRLFQRETILTRWK
jgi:ABC-2 type transport system permease protein